MHRSIFMGMLLATVAAPAAANEAPLAACMAARADAADLSGVALVVRKGVSTVFTRGKVAAPDSAAITADTRFNMGSMTKMFTAVAVAQLIDAGKVALDDSVGKHVDGLMPATSAVTVRQLLTHSGGLGSIFRPDTETILANARTTRDFKPIVASETPAFTPGERFQYSNSGFVLLGLLVEAASGQDYAAYLAAHILSRRACLRRA
jgi:D-alanyl-D-alanine carboxypeptidase